MAIKLYEKRLLNEPSVRKELSDIYYGIARPHNIKLQFSNTDGYFTDLLNAGEEFRNKGVKLRRYEPSDSTAITFELYGTTIDFNFTDIAEFTVSINDPDPLQTLLPRKVYEADDWTENSPNEINPERDLGKPYPLCFGMDVKKVPLIYVHANFQLMKFLTTHAGGGGNEYTYYKIWDGSYVIQSGDYLEYDIYSDNNNPGFFQGAEIEGSGWDGRSNALVDQNAISNNNGDIESYAKENWYSRKVDLTAVVGNTMTEVNVVNETDTGGNYITYYKRIRITDGAGTTRLTIWNSGAFDADTLNYSVGASSYSIALAKFFDYIIGPGVLDDVKTIYRSKVIVDSSEYTFYDGSQGLYSGYAFIRFTSEQRDFQGNLHAIDADVWGFTFGEAVHSMNIIDYIENILSNSTWGLGLTVNTTSFNIARTAVAGFGGANFRVDGVIVTQVKAQDILNELLFLCRGKLDKNEAGEWTIAIDTYQAIASATFGSKDGKYDNIIKISKYGKTPTKETIKKYTLNYRYNRWEEEYTHKNERIVFAFGEDKIHNTKWIRSHITADVVTCYQQKLMRQGDTKLTLAVGLEGRNLAIRNSIKVIIPRLNIDGIFQIRLIRKKHINYELDLISYDSTIYDYAVGTLPPSGNTDATPDYSNTPPDAPTSFTKDAEGTEQGSDGTTTTYFEFTANAPSSNFSHMIFGYKKAGSSAYKYLEGELSSGIVWKIRLEELVPGISYDFAAVSVNTFNLKSALTTLLSQLAPGDTTTPGTVTGLSGTGKYKTWHWEWTAKTDSDLKDYHVQIGTSSGGSNVFNGYVDGNSIDFTDDTQSYGTLYCKVKARDLTDNESSSWSSNVPTTTSKIQGGDSGDSELSPGTLDETDIKNDAISEIVEDSGTGVIALGTSDTTIASIAITTKANDDVLIIAKCTYQLSSDGSGANAFGYFKIKEGASLKDTQKVTRDMAINEVTNLPISMSVLLPNVSTGIHTYDFVGNKQSGYCNMDALYRRIQVLRVRR